MILLFLEFSSKKPSSLSPSHFLTVLSLPTANLAPISHSAKLTKPSILFIQLHHWQQHQNFPISNMNSGAATLRAAIWTLALQTAGSPSLNNSNRSASQILHMLSEPISLPVVPGMATPAHVLDPSKDESVESRKWSLVGLPNVSVALWLCSSPLTIFFT